VTAFESIKFVAFFIYAVLAVLAGAVIGVLACASQTLAEYLIACVQVLVTHPQGLLVRQQAGGIRPGPATSTGPRSRISATSGRWHGAGGRAPANDGSPQ
jgi:hypothetical protein